MGIQVSGGTIFVDSEWRNALNMFLKGMFTRNDSITYRPKVTFEHWGFEFWPNAGVYSFYATSDVMQLSGYRIDELATSYDPENIIECGCVQNDFERSLARFVSDRTIHMIIIHFPASRCLVLEKTQQRGVLLVTVSNADLTRDAFLRGVEAGGI